MVDSQFDAAIAAIDQANSGDPATIEVDGALRPKEQAHAELMTAWVRRLDPGADDIQLLAARAHHLRRWTLPRHDYPDGRAGYLKWRAELKRRHAADVGEILSQVGYGPEAIGRVQSIVRKENLRSDPATQVHEDALCLVFLTTQFDELIERLGADKAVDVVAKTIAKMSESAREAALALDLSPAGLDVVTRALAG